MNAHAHAHSVPRPYPPPHPESPLRQALASLSEAARTMNRAHVAAALRHLADAIDSAVSTSDQGLSKTRPGEPFGAAQKKNTAKIRHLSRNATSGSRRNLAGIEKSARTETGRAFRSQVRKIRLSRAHTKDEPGGEA